MTAKQSPQAGDDWSNGYKYYVLFVLTFVYILNIADRQILVVLQESIKKELHFSDSQLGILTGLAFALFYATLGIPIARLADRRSRRNIIVIAISLWSVMTALCGTVSRFGSLLAARIGVGVGEAGCTPPAVSIISDLFPQHKRATPMAIYSLGVTVGTFVGMAFGGLINQAYGWRMAFFLIGIPGILFALIVRFSVREPRRGMSDGVQKTAAAVPIKESMRALWESKAFVQLAIGTALLGMGAYGVLSWSAPFYERIHGMNSGEVGKWLGLLAGVGGGLGTFLGGVITDKLGRRNPRWYLMVPAISALMSVPLMFGGFFASTKGASLLFMGLAWFFSSMWFPAIVSLSQGLVKPANRAFAMAIVLLVLNLFGMGLGPTIGGFVSDLLKPTYDIESIRYALAGLLIAFIWGAAQLFYGSRHVEEGLRRVKEGS